MRRCSASTTRRCGAADRRAYRQPRSRSHTRVTKPATLRGGALWAREGWRPQRGFDPCAQRSHCSCCPLSLPAPMPPTSRAPRASMRSSSFHPAPRSRASARSSWSPATMSFCSPTCRRAHSRARSASRARPRAKLEIGSVDNRRMFVPRTDDAVAATERKRIEDAIEKLKDDRALLQAAVQAAEAQKTLISNLAQLPTQSSARQRSGAGAARLDADFRHDRPAPRRGAEGHPRDADQDARGRPADPRPGRQARLPGAGPGGAHRGQDVRQCRRRARGRYRHPLPGRRRLVGALLRCAACHRHQGAGAEAAAGAARQHPAAQRRELGQRRARRSRRPGPVPAPPRRSCGP